MIAYSACASARGLRRAARSCQTVVLPAAAHTAHVRSTAHPREASKDTILATTNSAPHEHHPSSQR